MNTVLSMSLTLGLCALVTVGMIIGADASSQGSLKIAFMLVLALSLLASMLWYRVAQRRYLLGLLFLTAPFDVSKAVVAPVGQFYSPALYVTVAEAVTVLLALVWAVEQLFQRRMKLPVSPLDALALGFLALVWFGALHAGAGVQSFSSATAYSLCVLGFYVVSHTVQTKEDVRLVLFMVFISFCLQAVYVAAQMGTHSFLTLPGAKVAPVGTQGLSFEAEQVEAFRPVGSFDHPNALASYLTLLLSPALALVLMTRRRLPARVWTAALVVLTVAVALLLLTLSRGGWAAFLLGAALVGVVYWRKHLIGSGYLLVIAGGTLTALIAVVAIYPQIVLRLTESDARSTESRIVLSDQALTIIKAHPLIGVGYGGYNRAAIDNTPPSFALISEDYQKQLLQLVVHNHYLLLAAELGVPAMLYWIFLMLRFIRQAWPLSRWKDPGMFALAVGLAGALLSQMLYLASDNYYADIRVFLLWVTAGVLQALNLQTDGAPRAAPLEAAP